MPAGRASCKSRGRVSTMPWGEARAARWRRPEAGFESDARGFQPGKRQSKTRCSRCKGTPSQAMERVQRCTPRGLHREPGGHGRGSAESRKYRSVTVHPAVRAKCCRNKRGGRARLGSPEGLKTGGQGALLCVPRYVRVWRVAGASRGPHGTTNQALEVPNGEGGATVPVPQVFPARKPVRRPGEPPASTMYALMTEVQRT